MEANSNNRDSPEQFPLHLYVKGKKLGEGTFAKVYRYNLRAQEEVVGDGHREPKAGLLLLLLLLLLLPPICQ